MRKTREERKADRSAKASRAANARWSQYHAALAESGAVIIYNQHHAFGEYEITIRSMRSGKVNTLHLHEGSRRDNFTATLNGLPWRTGSVSISTVTRIIRKSIVKTRSASIL